MLSSKRSDVLVVNSSVICIESDDCERALSCKSQSSDLRGGLLFGRELTVRARLERSPGNTEGQLIHEPTWSVKPEVRHVEGGGSSASRHRRSGSLFGTVRVV